MKKLPTRIHGMLDYFFGLAMICAPSFGRFSNMILPSAIFIVLGVTIVAYSLFTRYEHGPYGVLPVKLNLKFDIGVAIFVMASPFLFGFSASVIWTNMVLGGLMLGTALISETEAPLEEKKQVRPLRATRDHMYRLYGRSRNAHR
jgi:hypothetical protein